MHKYLEGYLTLGNTVTYSLSDVVERVLDHVKQHPSEQILLALDVDDALISSPKKDGGYDFSASVPLHPESDRLLRVLHKLGVHLMLLTAGCYTDIKLHAANIGGDLFQGVAESVVNKGKALVVYIQTLDQLKQPKHIFFMDDQAFAHCEQGSFITTVKSEIAGVTVFQHNEHHFYKDRNRQVYENQPRANGEYCGH